MQRISLWLTIIVGLIVPTSYCVVEYNKQIANNLFDARLVAAGINRLINANPEYWMFEEPRLLALIGKVNTENTLDQFEARQIVDKNGEIIVKNDVDTPWPTVTSSSDLLDSGNPVGRIDVTRSVFSNRAQIFGVLFIGVAIGLGFFFTLRRFPLAALQRALSLLVQEKDRAQVTLHSIGDAVITTDANGFVTYVNPVAEHLTGYSLAEAIGQSAATIYTLVSEVSGDRLENPVTRAIHEKRKVIATNEALLIRNDGTTIAVDESATPIIDTNHSLNGFVLVFHDTSQSRELSAKLSYQASHDALTGLINRRELEIRLDRALGTARFENRVHSLAYIDLDQFKIVNDTCGHHAGDELLRQVCSLIRGKIRSSDSFARLGGDEFALLLDGCPLDIAQRVCTGVLRAVQEFRFIWEGQPFSVGASIGVVVIDNDSGTTSQILSAADSACYTAKEQGRGRVYVYKQGDNEVDSRRGAMGFVSRITKAIDENRLRLFFQPIKPLVENDSLDHFEILIRMVDEDGNQIPPGVFIPPAERFNLMHIIDRWVIGTTFQSLAEIYGDAIEDKLGNCSINLSGVSWTDDNIVDFIIERAKQNNIPPRAICFEITETAAIGNLNRAIQFIQQLRTHGFRFALDDFGSGVSSFGYLKQLPVDFLKIDGLFVKNMLSDNIDRAMVETINEIGHIMGVQTIAEFVENDEIERALHSMGVDHGQGFGIAKPQPIWMLNVRDSK